MAEIASEAELRELRSQLLVMTRTEIRAWGWGILAWCTAAVAGIAAAFYFHLAVLGLVSVAMAFLAQVLVECWIGHYETYRDHWRYVHSYSFQREIEDLERNLGVGLGEDWWRP